MVIVDVPTPTGVNVNTFVLVLTLHVTYVSSALEHVTFPSPSYVYDTSSVFPL